MLDGVDIQKDAMGIVRTEEFICGDCGKTMTEFTQSKFRCPKCGKEFDNTRRK
jgi:tRNA(Ile2) C34 agmatinyltransferase TiaS